ncbi:hypothetical protein NY98_21810 [Xanthomonas citri pv. fuscans]|uniref:Uncharacterized protein n=2 Tax=Xanthomonas TaxID=338 RepID=A0AB34Q1E3_XANCI|nr:hypothetical protein AC612_22475 [Xanthomonas citri pv. fuscans]KGP23983.1 hypothetical protein NY65_17380 [Xanthomonas phaseoli pv. phaseoli]KGK64185.1 hypothetical protein NB99_20930 [Xanthomonas citri pv. fuscans]KGP21629.1 hypothetical protein NY68_21240 [Xanthomonas citri pv. fuscans]KGP23675.1 hypothetical protein NY67_17390 [Xanthomonas citri pv. fuscans]
MIFHQQWRFIVDRPCIVQLAVQDRYGISELRQRGRMLPCCDSQCVMHKLIIQSFLVTQTVVPIQYDNLFYLRSLD